MTAVEAFLDEGPGETRAAVFSHGAPERLLVERMDRPELQSPGAVFAGRVRKINGALRAAFIDLGVGEDALLPYTRPPVEGGVLEVEVIAAPRREKAAVLRSRGPGAGPPRLLCPAPDLRAMLAALAPGVAPQGGRAARDAVDLAEAQALAVSHDLPGGGRIHIEPTRALVAVDVDLGAAAGDAGRAAARVNAAAIVASARLLRLKRLGGLVAIDLIGKGHDGARLLATARSAFAADGEGVSFGPISRFGVFELAVPRDLAPISDFFLGACGEETVETRVYRLLRAAESAAGPGLRVTARCGAALYAAALPLMPRLTERIGARAVLEMAPAAEPYFCEVFDR